MYGVDASVDMGRPDTEWGPKATLALYLLLTNCPRADFPQGPGGVGHRAQASSGSSSCSSSIQPRRPWRDHSTCSENMTWIASPRGHDGHVLSVDVAQLLRVASGCHC